VSSYRAFLFNVDRILYYYAAIENGAEKPGIDHHEFERCFYTVALNFAKC